MLTEWPTASMHLYNPHAARGDAPPRRLPCCAAFLPYLEEQMAELNDTTLQQEVDLLEKLIAL